MAKATKPIDFQHSDAAEEWANSDERINIFTVTRRNPERDEWDEMEHKPEGEEPPAETISETYTVPAKPNPGLGLQYLRYARQDLAVAMSWLLEVALGADGYDALVEELAVYNKSEGPYSVDEGQKLMSQLSERVQGIVLGGLEAPKG